MGKVAEKVISHGVTAGGDVIPLRIDSNGAAAPSTPASSTSSYGQKSIGTSATEIVPANANRRAVVIVNHGDADVFIGGSGVATTTGILLAGTKGTGITLTGSDAVYGIVAASTQTVSFVEETFS